MKTHDYIVFNDLDVDNDGIITYNELLNAKEMIESSKRKAIANTTIEVTT